MYHADTRLGEARQALLIASQKTDCPEPCSRGGTTGADSTGIRYTREVMLVATRLVLPSGKYTALPLSAPQARACPPFGAPR